MSKLRISYHNQLRRTDEWNPITLHGNPVSSVLVKAYLKFTREKQRQVGVAAKQAPILMPPQLSKLVSHTRRTARSRKTIGERIFITKDMALFCVAFHTCGRGFDISCTLGTLFVWIVSAMTVTKVVEGCVYIRRRCYGILLRVGGEFEHSALSPLSLRSLSDLSLSRSVL